MSNSPMNPWIVAAAAIAGTCIVLAGHSLLPRYDWHVVADGHAIVVFDKWSGRFQRAEWDSEGKPHLSDVYTAP